MDTDILKKDLLPQAEDAEKSVLGSILLEPESLLKIADFLQTDDFYYEHNRMIYSVCLELFLKSSPIDLVTVSLELESQKKLEKTGGSNYLAELQNLLPITSHIYKYAEIVRHRATLRKLIKAGNKIMALGHDMEKNVDELLDEAEKQIFAISQNFIKDRFVSLQEIVDKTYTNLCNVYENPEIRLKNRVGTQFADLDRFLNGGFNASDLVIVAARPSMGKTALALAFAQNAALHFNKKVGVVSLEMSKEQLVERMFCGELQIDSWKLYNGKLTEEDFEKMGEVMDKLGRAPIFIDDSFGNSMVELKAKTRRLKMEQGLDFLLIDYLQLMSSGSNTMNRVQEISEISRNLKSLARELHIPIIALSQLSRAVESRPDKRPVLSDLRESGAIEQDADVVMMLYREDYYNSDCPEEEKQTLEVNIAKHRNGAVGKVNLFFDRSKMMISDLGKQGQAKFNTPIIKTTQNKNSSAVPFFGQSA